MITFDEIKTLIGTEDFHTYYSLIKKIHSVEVAQAIILLLIEQKAASEIRGKLMIDDLKKRHWIKDGLYHVSEKFLIHALLDYEAYDVLDVWDEENSKNDIESN